MKYLKRVIGDVRNGENIDLYVTLLLAIVLTFLSIFGSPSNEIVSALNLTILALIAISLLINRHQVHEIKDYLEKDTNQVLLHDWPNDEVIRNLTEAQEVLIIGVSLLRTIRNYFGIIEDLLKKGRKVRVLILNPECEAVKITANRHYIKETLEDSKNKIFLSLKTMDNLTTVGTHNFEVRLTDTVLTFGGFWIKNGDTEGLIYLENYTYKMREDDIPKLIIHSSVKYWYGFYQKQAEVLYMNAKTYLSPKTDFPPT